MIRRSANGCRNELHGLERYLNVFRGFPGYFFNQIAERDGQRALRDLKMPETDSARKFTPENIFSERIWTTLRFSCKKKYLAEQVGTSALRQISLSPIEPPSNFSRVRVLGGPSGASLRR